MAKQGRNLALGALIAAAVGYVAGILTAPKSGKETRKDIQNTAVRAKTEAEKKLKSLHSELTELITAGKQKVKTAKDTAKHELTEALDKAQSAKDKARDLLSALHEGGADDKDLQQAMKEAKQAIDHLKKFMQRTNAKSS